MIKAITQRGACREQQTKLKFTEEGWLLKSLLGIILLLLMGWGFEAAVWQFWCCEIKVTPGNTSHRCPFTTMWSHYIKVRRLISDVDILLLSAEHASIVSTRTQVLLFSLISWQLLLYSASLISSSPDFCLSAWRKIFSLCWPVR